MLTMVNPLLLRRFIGSQNINPLDKISSLVSITTNNHFEFFLNVANDGLFQPQPMNTCHHDVRVGGHETLYKVERKSCLKNGKNRVCNFLGAFTSLDARSKNIKAMPHFVLQCGVHVLEKKLEVHVENECHLMHINVKLQERWAYLFPNLLTILELICFKLNF